MNIDINGVSIKLTPEQLQHIQKELNNKPLIERLFSWQDILDYNNVKEEAVIPWKNPINNLQISQNGIAKLQLIKATFNESWIEDFNNKNQVKWYTWFEKNNKKDWSVLYVGDDYYYCGSVGFGLYSKSKENENHINKYFMKEICEFLS